MRPRVASLLGIALALGGPAIADEAAAPALRLAIDDTCPDRSALEGALGTEGLRIREGDAAALRLAVRSSGDRVAVELADPEGRVLLERVLPAGDCRALADAVALLVERRVSGVDADVALPLEQSAVSEDERASAAPELVAAAPARADPIPAAWSIEGRGGLLVSTALGAAAGPFAGARIGSGLFSTAAWIGFLRTEVPVAEAGAVEVDRVPFALALGAATSWRTVTFGAHAAVEAEAFRLRSRLPRSMAQSGASVRAGPLLSIGVEPWRHVTIGADLGALVRLVGYRFVVGGLGDVGGHAPLAVEAMLSLGYRTGGAS